MTASEYLPRLRFDYTAHQPITSCGFRKGQWTVLLDGKPMKVHAVVPRHAELDLQEALVLGAAARQLARRNG